MTSSTEKSWTGNIGSGSHVEIDVILEKICQAFNPEASFTISLNSLLLFDKSPANKLS